MNLKYAWAAAVVITGCASLPDETVTPAALTNPGNEIVHLGYSFRIPDEWSYRPADTVGPIFAFESDSGVSGTFDPLNIDEAADSSAMVDYFATQIMQGDAAPNQTVLESDVVGSILVVSADHERGEYRSYFVTDREWRFAIHLELDSSGAYALDAFLPIVESVRHARPSTSARSAAEDALGILSTDGKWRWVSDYAGGYVAGTSGVQEPLRLVGIWPASDEQIERFEARDDTVFVTDVSVPYGTTAARVFASEAEDGSQLFAFFVRGDAQYCVSIQRPEPLEVLTPEVAKGELIAGAVAEFVGTVVVFPDETAL